MGRSIVLQLDDTFLCVPSFVLSKWITRADDVPNFPALLKPKHSPINKFKVEPVWFCMWKLSSAATLSKGIRIWYFFVCSFPAKKSKTCECETNEKLLFTTDQENENRTKMTFTSENLWATEREFSPCKESSKVASTLRFKKWEWTDSLLRESGRQFVKEFPQKFYDRNSFARVQFQAKPSNWTSLKFCNDQDEKFMNRILFRHTNRNLNSSLEHTLLLI